MSSSWYRDGLVVSTKLLQHCAVAAQTCIRMLCTRAMSTIHPMRQVNSRQPAVLRPRAAPEVQDVLLQGQHCIITFILVLVPNTCGLEWPHVVARSPS
jgi:hypothetical protein